MWMTQLTLVATDNDAASIRSQTVVDILWSAVRPEDRIEHIWARSSAERIDLVVFSLVGSKSARLRVITALCQRAGASSPLFRGWLPSPPHHDFAR